MSADCIECHKGITPLIIAVLHQRRDIVRMLIECGADVNQVNDEGFTPLMLASVRNTGATLGRLLDAGADITALNDNRVSALGLAIRCVQPKNVRSLLAHEASSGLTNDDLSRAQAYARDLKATAMRTVQHRPVVAFHPQPELIPITGKRSFELLCSSPQRDVQGLEDILTILDEASS